MAFLRELEKGTLSSSPVVSNLLATGTSFMKDNFSTDQGRGDGFGMIEVHYIFVHSISLIITLLYAMK